MATKKIEIQDSNGNVYYPHTDASVVKNGSKTVAEQLNDLTNDISEFSNPNILINSNFINPINQRKQITYNEWGKYTIDRWLNQTKKVEIQSDGILITMDVQYGNIVQKFENANIFKGKVVTLSGELEVINGSVYSELNVQDSDNNNTLYCNKAFDVGAHKFSIKGVLKEDITSIFLGITNGNAGESKVKLKRLKLEFGSKATPFIPRLYGEELLLCKRYYEETNYDTLMTGVRNYEEYFLEYKYDVEKRVAPSIKCGNSTTPDQLYLFKSTGNVLITPKSIIPETKKARFSFSTNGDSSIVGSSFAVTGWVKIDAEIY